MKQLRITVNGKAYDVQVEELGASAAPAVAAPAPVSTAPAPAAPAAAAPAAPAAAAAPGAGEAVNAPMPGTILDVMVKAGDPVKNGQALVVLEAMKMENEICAPVDGTVKSIAVATGATVNTDDLLVVLG